MNPLTKTQSKILAFIRRYRDLEGWPPTRQEISDHFGYKSRNAADEHLRSLERKGVITLSPGVARGIRLTESKGTEVRLERPTSDREPHR